ncbi:MAG: M81 family metallopeptidase [Deltaproteobacteria bacterium]|nr:M81 family metallopeptidase [Deltaproteobacteria bacterium]
MTRRIAYARINQETNALSPVPTTLDDFKSVHDLEGAHLLDATSRVRPEIKGMFRRAELTGFIDALRKRPGYEPVPLFSTWAIASGALTTETFEALSTRLLESLDKAPKLDAVYLALHGALGVRGVPDPEAELIRRVRSVVGGLPIAVSYDLHGNLTKAKVAASDALVAYGTNPHRDHVRVGRKCGDVLMDMIEGRVKPTIAWRSLPMILGGGNTIDFLSPMRPVFSRSRKMERESKVLSTSVLMCHLRGDRAREERHDRAKARHRRDGRRLRRRHRRRARREHGAPRRVARGRCPAPRVCANPRSGRGRCFVVK